MAVLMHVKEPPRSYRKTSHPMFIQEETRTYKNHDQLFKELINHFFEEFLEVFFPEQHALIDFESITPLSENLYTDLIDGENRQVDIVIEAKLKEEDTLIVVHVEPQSSYQRNFHERMYLYFNFLYQKYRKPILPIAVFSYDYKRTEKDQFTIDFPGFQVLSFHFLMLELKKKNWREYLQTDNPVAAALLSKMGYKEEEKVEVRKEFLRMILRMKLNPGDTRFINDFFEEYLTLNKEEEEVLMKEISQMEDAHEFIKLSNSWEDRGIRKGKMEVVIEMLREGASIEFIMKVTRLDKATIEGLRKELEE